MKDTKSSKKWTLPAPDLKGNRSLEETLATRRSVRDFTDESLAVTELSQLLWAAQGVTDGEGLRTAPSAGALYPLELYVAQLAGVYQYEPSQHQLDRKEDRDVRRALCDVALGQDAIAAAPAVFILTAVYARTRKKYGPHTERYVHMEAGHAAQNLLLEAAALNLGGVVIAAFDDEDVSEVLRLPKTESPLYLIPVGHPVP
jgi:SagB-type dehydrogenase family enzyme